MSRNERRKCPATRATRQAHHSAGKFAEVSSHAEEAMRRIEESSQQISNITGVIDEIVRREPSHDDCCVDHRSPRSRTAPRSAEVAKAA